jgi:hypothetical protein
MKPHIHHNSLPRPPLLYVMPPLLVLQSLRHIGFGHLHDKDRQGNQRSELSVVQQWLGPEKHNTNAT